MNEKKKREEDDARWWGNATDAQRAEALCDSMRTDILAVAYGKWSASTESLLRLRPKLPEADSRRAWLTSWYNANAIMEESNRDYDWGQDD